jgi:hypothetical protein
MVKRLKQTFLPKMINKWQPLKRCSTSLVIKKMQIKITIIYYFTPTKMAIVFKANKQVLRCGEIGILVHCWWQCKM